MRTFLVYLKLELKRALRILPWTAAGAMVLAGLLGAIALFAVRTLEGGEELNKLKVGVILPEEDALPVPGRGRPLSFYAGVFGKCRKYLPICFRRLGGRANPDERRGAGLPYGSAG